MTQPDAPLHFEDFEIDPARGELRRKGAPVAVEPQVLDLLYALARAAGRVLSRDEIIEQVWQGRIVSDSAISTRINAARAAIGDDGAQQRVIRTVPRRGFLFAADVSSEAPKPRVSDKPAIAVLPFRNLSGDPEQSYFSDGIADDILTDLSRYGELFVTARHSSFAYRDSRLATPEIAEELGVRYLVEGSVRRAGNRVRVSVQLSDAAEAETLWSDRYDRELEDIFAVQDEITTLVVNTVAGQVRRQHYKRALARGPDAADAYDHTLRAMELLWRFGKVQRRSGRAAAEAALALDPGLARAHALRSIMILSEVSNPDAAGPGAAEAFRECHLSAVAAVEADDREPWGHAARALSELWGRKDHAQAVASIRTATRLNPSHAHFRAMLGLMQVYAGEPAAGLVDIDTALAQNPHAPYAYRLWRARALFSLGEVEAALLEAQPGYAEMPDHTNAMVLLAAAAGASGDTARAAEISTLILADVPDFSLPILRDTAPYADPAHFEAYRAGLAAAGLPV